MDIARELRVGCRDGDEIDEPRVAARERRREASDRDAGAERDDLARLLPGTTSRRKAQLELGRVHRLLLLTSLRGRWAGTPRHTMHEGSPSLPRATRSAPYS